MKTRYTIRKPRGRSKSFAIVKDTRSASGKRVQETVDDESIDALNCNLGSGLIGMADAAVQIKTIKARLLKRDGVLYERDLEATLSEHNLTVLRKFWKSLTSKRFLKNGGKSSENDLKAALAHIEPLPLTTATRDQIIKKLETLSDKKYRRFAIRLNSLLQFLGRGFTIVLPQVDQEEVHYLTWDELQKVLPKLPSDDSRVLAQVLFCTGVREGEAFCLTARKMKPNGAIFVDKQLKRDGTTDRLKNGKPHDTVLLPQGKAAFKAWCEMPKDRREDLRHKITRQILRASQRTFKDAAHHVSSHDLRHSYAIYLLERRATVTEIASLLGDTEATVRRHYTGWIQSDRMVDNINALLTG